MIKRFVFGTPFPTESVVLDLPVETGPVPFLTPDGDGWTYRRAGPCGAACA